MALAETATKLTNLFNPEVIADLLDVKLIDALKFAPLAKIDTTLVGSAGNTVKLPYYSYIGDASVVAEGADIPIKQLTQTTKPVQIQKVGNGIQITDEAVLSGYGDPIGEAVSQLAISIASKVDNDLLGALAAITTAGGGLEYTSAANTVLTADDIANALTLFGEDIDGDKVILVDATTYANLRKSTTWMPASDISADTYLKGVVGQVQGTQVVVTNRIKGANAGKAFIVKPGALALFLKRDTLVETDRDIINKSTVITADKHYASYLLNAGKAIKLNPHTA